MINKKVEELMTSPAITIEDNVSIKEAIEVMKNKKIGFLPITKKNVIIGVVTDRDILIRGVGKYKLNAKIRNIMTSGEIHFVSPSDMLEDAAKIMSKNKIRRLVVLNDGYVVGILTSKCLLKEHTLIPYIIDTYEENTTLPGYQIYNNANPHDSIKAPDYPL